ncbi:hypothetical protein NEMIN01_2329 [Nematocida minor]|uniref:uncharacterized protein n=1 Tax=Nematocida minor TaxID=1912983 RepID=UPI00221E574E|nr:uncharacterized protein NEMIN01_2329 [Nematocida minor]KAI5192977.1 hypothetical protein NEMIN01_2329 [Nematocida minor]
MNENSKKKLPSEKRREKFHELFKSIPKNEGLEYSCPCILKDNSKYFQGRMYISNEHISFFSKNFFGRITLIINIRNIIAIELKTTMILSGSLEIITYDKTYSFKSVFYKEEAYPIALLHWQKLMGLPSNVKSIFQVDIPRPNEMVEERAMSEEERVFDIELRKLVRSIVNTHSTVKFYQTLTNDEIEVKTYTNRRTIQFSNEFIDEVYSVNKNAILIEYHSRGTLCRIFITAEAKGKTKVRIIEKYNYTTQHYFKYIEGLVGSSKSRKHSQIAMLCVCILGISLKIASIFKYLYHEYGK